MFEDRFEQFVILGIPKTEVEEMRATINDMWSDAPGGWVYEWSELARRYVDADQLYMASLAYGCAKFPCLANEPKKKALANQVATYLAAAPSFPVKFERRFIGLPFGHSIVSLPVHLFSSSDRFDEAPVLLVSGGVDTWKMDTHAMFVALARRVRVTIVAFDQPGTGENPAPLAIEADEIVLGLVKETRKIGNGKTAHLGISFGGNYSAMTGLLGAVDGAIVLGGPVDQSFTSESLARLPFGMADIIGNDIGFDHRPSSAEVFSATAKLSRRALLDRTDNAPMLVINGEDDYFIPQSDTRVFEGRPNTEVHLIPGTGHCAFSKLPDVMTIISRWLPKQLNI
jgi:esterase FrsA